MNGQSLLPGKIRKKKHLVTNLSSVKLVQRVVEVTEDVIFRRCVVII